MPINLTCPKCRSGIRVPDAAAGKTARCPHCGDRVHVKRYSRSLSWVIFAAVALFLLIIGGAIWWAMTGRN